MNDDELAQLRQKRMEELQRQQQSQQNQQAYNQQAAQAQQQADFERQKAALLVQILSSEARSRLTNLRMTRAEFVQELEVQLIKSHQQGALGGQTPLSDDRLKEILLQLQNSSQKRERKIRFR
jgi:programmed cell death protein 5